MKTLLLLHGALGSATQFDTLKEALSDKFTVTTLNFSGHGGREIPSSGFSMELFADDIAAHLDNAGIEQADIFGYSMGGYAALLLASRQPERIRSVFTLATKFLWNEEISRKEAAMLNPDKISQKVPAFARQLTERHAPQSWEKVVLQTAEMMVKLGANPLLTHEIAGRLEMPVRVSIGDRDTMVTLDETAAMFRALKNGSLAVLPGTPHPFEKVNIVRLAGELADFFGE